MDLPYIPKNDDEKRILSLYSTAIEACTVPEPLLSAEGVEHIIRETSEAFADYIIKTNLPEIYPAQIPVGGEIVTKKLIELSKEKLTNNGITIHKPFSLPISRYGEDGTVGKEPRLPDGFVLPTKVVNSIYNKEVPIGEDILDGAQTLLFADEYLRHIGASGIVAFVLFERKGKKPPQKFKKCVAHILDTDAWVLGAGCLDINAGLGRNLGPLYASKDYVVRPMTNSELKKLGKKEREEREIFEKCLNALRRERVNGQSARKFIERELPLMTLEELNLYQ